MDEFHTTFIPFYVGMTPHLIFNRSCLPVAQQLKQACRDGPLQLTGRSLAELDYFEAAASTSRPDIKGPARSNFILSNFSLRASDIHLSHCLSARIFRQLQLPEVSTEDIFHSLVVFTLGT